jgi:hypothetical protein
MTAKGQQVIDEVGPAHQRKLASLWAGLTPKEKLLLVHLLAKLRMNLLSRYAEEADEGEPSMNHNRYFRRRAPFRI